MSDGQKRIDDLVNGDGVPVSAAHQSLYDHLDDCKVEILTHVDSVMAIHVKERHHLSMTDLLADSRLTPETLITSVIAMYEIVPGLTDFVYGPPLVDAATGKVLVDGNDVILRDKTKGAQQAVNNGGFPVKMPKWLVTLLVATIGGVFTLAAAIIQNW